MNKMLIAVFESDKRAYEGLTALKNLHRNGDISLYATAVIHKDQNGMIDVRESADQGPIGTGVGLLTGSLIGAIAGPAGLAIGAFAGTVGGLIWDIGADDINFDFAGDVAAALSNGKTAVICEIDESWTVPVDTEMNALGGIVFRRFKYEVVDDQLEREAEAISNEMNSLKEELRENREANKAKVEAAMKRMKGKAEALNEILKKKMDDSQKQFEAKLGAIREQMKNAKERRKAILQKRIDVLTAEYNRRSEKLRQASGLVREAFQITRREEVLAVE